MRARPGAYTALAVVAWLFAACILVQVFLAGLGVSTDSTVRQPHRNFGYPFGLADARDGDHRGGRAAPAPVLIGLSLLALVQFALQSVFIVFREDLPADALHPVNGVLLLVVAIAIGQIAWAGRPLRRPARLRAPPAEAAS